MKKTGNILFPFFDDYCIIISGSFLMTNNTKEITIVTEYIELQQLLKKIDLISSGGEAKIFLSENQVLVDGEEDNRRGRKLYPGMIVEIFGVKYHIKK